MPSALKTLKRIQAPKSPSQNLLLKYSEVFGILTTSFVKNKQDDEYSQVAITSSTPP